MIQKQVFESNYFIWLEFKQNKIGFRLVSRTGHEMGPVIWIVLYLKNIGESAMLDSNIKLHQENKNVKHKHLDTIRQDLFPHWRSKEKN